jgi:hypothetical protein
MWLVIPKSISFAPTLTGDKSHEKNVQNKRLPCILGAMIEAPLISDEGKLQSTGYRRLRRDVARSLAKAFLPALHYREPPTVNRVFHPQEDGTVSHAHRLAPMSSSFTWLQSLFSDLVAAVADGWTER